MRRLGLAAAVVVFAGAVGGVAGWLFPWVASAIAAASLVALGGLAYWMRGRFNELRKRQLAQLKQQERTHEQVKKLIAKLAAAEKVGTAEHKRAMRTFNTAIQGRTTAVAKTLTAVSRREGQQTRRHADRLFRQAEALQSLHQLIDVRHAMPPSRGWAASPDLLLTYVEEILESKPATIVECGSGLSTVWAAYAVQRNGGNGRVVALDHDAEFAEKTRANLAEHGLTEFAEVRHAPLVPVELAESTWQWYDPAALKDVHDIDVVLVDGPPKPTGEHARYPAIPVLRDLLAPGAVVLIDDAARPDEQAILERWQNEWPELAVEQLPHEKGAARLVAPGA